MLCILTIKYAREKQMLLRKSRGRENIFIALYVFIEEHLCVSRPMQFNPGCSKFNYIIKKTPMELKWHTWKCLFNTKQGSNRRLEKQKHQKTHTKQIAK